MAGAGQIRAARAFVELSANDSLFQATMRRVEAKVRGTGEMLRRWGGGAMLGGAGLAAALAPAVATFVEFDDVMREVQAKAQATGEEFDRLKTKALALAKTTGFAAAEVGRMMVELATRGFDAAGIERMTESVLLLARATGAEGVASADLLGTVLQQFQMDAGEAAKVADLLTAAVNKSAVSVESLRYTFKYVGPVAKDLGQTLEDTLALSGALAQAGIGGEVGGTALRRLSLLASGGGGDLERLFGVSGTDAAGKVRPLVDVLSDIFAVTSKLSDADRVSRMTEAFGILGITSASALTRGTQTVRDLRDELDRADGVARATAATMEGGLGGAWRRLKANVVEAAVALGEALAPALTVTASLFQGAAAGVSRFVRDNREAVAVLVPVIAAVTAAGLALAAAGVVVGGLGLGLSAALAAAKLVAAGFLFLLSPVGLVTAAVTGLVGALVYMSGAGGALRAGLADLAETFRATFGGVVAAIRKGDLNLAWEIAVAGMKVAWKDLLIALRAGWDRFKAYMLSLDWVGDLVRGVHDAMKGAAEAIVGATGLKPVDAAALAAAARKEADRRAGLRAERDRLDAAYNLENRALTDLRLRLSDPGTDGAVRRSMQEEADRTERRMDQIAKAMRQLGEEMAAGAKPAGPAESDALKALKAEREDLRKELQRLIDLANRPEPVPAPGLPVAPRPREVGAGSGFPALVQRVGDAARGTFQSGDFRGFFGLGPANTVPRQQLDAIRDVAEVGRQSRDLLARIEQKVGPMVFG